MTFQPEGFFSNETYVIHSGGMPVGTMVKGDFTVCVRAMVYHFRGNYATLVSYATRTSESTLHIGK